MTPSLAPSSWSPHWRSLHPVCTDEEVLDALRLYLQKKFAPHFAGRALTSLRLFRHGPPYFRLPNGDLCHWAQTTKAASLSIEAAICAHMPFLWSKAHKQYALPNGQKAAEPLGLVMSKAPFPDILTVLTVQPLFFVPRRRVYQLRLNRRVRDPRWGLILCNAAEPAHKPPGLHALIMEEFRPRPHAKIRFCISRDPVERFISAVAYLQKGLRAIKDKSPQEILEQRIAKLEDAQRKSENSDFYLDEHLRSQIYFIGRDPSYYTHIFRMGEWRRLEYFLSDWLGAPVQLPHNNKSESA